MGYFCDNNGVGLEPASLSPEAIKWATFVTIMEWALIFSNIRYLSMSSKQVSIDGIMLTQVHG